VDSGDESAGAAGVDLAVEQVAHGLVEEAVKAADGVEWFKRGGDGAKRLSAGAFGVVVEAEAAAARGGHAAGTAGRHDVGAKSDFLGFHAC
jgi:hypothetical protein